MRTRLIIAWLCNLVDIAATLYLSGLGYVEANLAMAWLLQWPWLFSMVKLSAMTFVLLFLWNNREDRHALPLATFTAVVYGLIAIYYIVIFAVLKGDFL